MRTADFGGRLQVPEDRPKLGIRLLKTVDHLPRRLEEPPRILADAADVSCFDGLPKFADERLQICADFGNISSGDGLVEVGEQVGQRVDHPSDIETLDLTHDSVDRIEHVGELAWRGGDVIVVREAPRRRSFR